MDLTLFLQLFFNRKLGIGTIVPVRIQPARIWDTFIRTIVLNRGGGWVCLWSHCLLSSRCLDVPECRPMNSSSISSYPASLGSSLNLCFPGTNFLSAFRGSSQQRHAVRRRQTSIFSPVLDHQKCPLAISLIPPLIAISVN